jgi:hypothetical protein
MLLHLNKLHDISFVYLFTYLLLLDDVSSSYYVALNGWMINKQVCKGVLFQVHQNFKGILHATTYELRILQHPTSFLH